MRNYLTILLLCLSFYLSATHIVGGEINYRCLGNNQYEITLRVFRDCDTGVPWFDNPASVGVFNAQDSLIFDLRLLMRENDTLDLNLTDPCLVAPPNVCIHTTSYVDTVYLPFVVGGYQLVYQRCCRNQDIVNIVNPLDAGATYFCLITEEALLSCNSSAVFNAWPPVYICVNRPIIFNHSAIDADGDSLVYEMCTPLDGANPQNPMPQPPYNPPYIPVNWLPGFSSSNMLGGIDSLRINPNTGLLQGTPTLMGVFVVGICVSEYRNGQLISTSRRDFQYAIGNCGQLVTAAFFAPSIQCDNSLTVSFQNNSQSLGTGYIWNFGDSTNQTGSTLQNPTYIYPDTGSYLVTLISDPNSLCADTMTQWINLQRASILMDFDVDLIQCEDTVVLQVVDLSIDSLSTITQWNWNFGNGSFSNQPFAQAYYTQSGSYPISLTITSANGCTSTQSDTVDFLVANITNDDTLAICPGQTQLILNPLGDTNLIYQWAPALGLSDPNAASPVATVNSSTNYAVTITALNGTDTCRTIKNVHILISPPINYNPIQDTITCNDSVRILLPSSNQYTWSTNNNFIPVLSNTSQMLSILPSFNSNQVYFVRVRNNYGCELIDSFQISRQNLPFLVDIGHRYNVCTDSMEVQFLDLTIDSTRGSIQNWVWDFGNGSGSLLENPIYTYGNSGTYYVSLRATSTEGCVSIGFDTIQLAQLPSFGSYDSIGICPGFNTVQLNANGPTALSYQWAPSAGLSASNIANPIANPSVPTMYQVTVTSTIDSLFCRLVDSVFVFFPTAAQVLVPDYEYCGNSFSALAQATNAGTFEWSFDPNFLNVFSTTNPTPVFPTQFPTMNLFVRFTDIYGCIATDTSLLTANNPQINPSYITNLLSCSDTVRIRFENTTNPPPGTTINNFYWSVSGANYFQTSTLENPIFQFTQSGNYIVTLSVRLSNGCGGLVTLPLEINRPSINSPATVALCNGQSQVQLNPNGDSTGVTYLWSPGTGLSQNNIPSPIASPAQFPAQYQVTVTAQNSFGVCQQSRTLTIIQAAPVQISIPSDTTFCSTNYLIYANPGMGIVSWDWTTDPTLSSFFLTNANPVSLGFSTQPQNFTIFIRGFDQYGCTVIDTGIYRFDTSTVLLQPSYQVDRCFDDSLRIIFSDTNTYAGAIQTYQWNFGAGLNSNQQIDTITFGPADTTHNYSLSVVLRNGCRGYFSDSIPYQAAFFAQNDSIGLCGDTNAIILNQGAHPSLIYRWSPGLYLSDSTISNPVFTPGNDISYMVTIISPNGGDTCVGLHEFVIQTQELDVDLVDDTILCSNQILLQAQGPSNFLYEWSLNSQFTQIIGQQNPLFTYINNSRKIYLRTRNNLGCEKIDSIQIWVRNQPIDVQLNYQILNCTDSLVLSLNDVTTDTFGLSPIQRLWSLPNQLTSSAPNINLVLHSNTQDSILLEIVSSNGCRGSRSIPVDIKLPRSLSLPDTLKNCNQNAFQLNPAGDSTLYYLWSPSNGLNSDRVFNPIATVSGMQQYQVQIGTSIQIGNLRDTCFINDSVLVISPPALVYNVNIDTQICDPTVLLQISSNASQISWTQLPALFLGQGDSILIQRPPGIYRFRFQLQDSFLCEWVDTISAEVRNLQVTVDSASIFCPNQPATLHVSNFSATDQLNYYWSPDSIIIYGQQTATIQATPSAAQMMSVLVQNQYGCIDTLNSWIQVSGQTPPLQVAAYPDTVFAGATVQLNSTFDSNYIYQWTYQEGMTATQIYNPRAIVEVPSLYVLQITDSLGCRNTDSIWVYTKSFVCDEPYVFVPNTFTPNSDGFNDLVFVRGNVISEMYFAIYNRWGQLMFETADQNLGWDGTFNGEVLTPDVYGYYLKYKCVGQNAAEPFILKKGNITLVR
jgi:gliding motility-associated-like protein